MKLLHTSDWHLGRMLYTKKERTEEHTAFLEWLLATIQENSVDALLVAGDIFDTASPGFLNVPKEILSALNVCVIGNGYSRIEIHT
ncbi:hypothetical protein FACS189446_6550 [Bacteroidia bacterium]|nr:hypothetical protein FACS189446_6550 [Bacteroidia bacterium]